jgi:hypothetical protein
MVLSDLYYDYFINYLNDYEYKFLPLDIVGKFIEIYFFQIRN